MSTVMVTFVGGPLDLTRQAMMDPPRDWFVPAIKRPYVGGFAKGHENPKDVHADLVGAKLVRCRYELIPILVHRTRVRHLDWALFDDDGRTRIYFYAGED